MADKPTRPSHLCCPCGKALLQVESEHAPDTVALHVHCEACGLDIVLGEEEIAQAVKRAALEKLRGSW